MNTQGWPVFRQRLEEMFDEIIRRESKAEIQRLKKPDSDVPIGPVRSLFDSSLFLCLDVVARPSEPTDATTNQSNLPFLGAPHGGRSLAMKQESSKRSSLEKLGRQLFRLACRISAGSSGYGAFVNRRQGCVPPWPA